jgi:hypothetical protein
MSKCRMISFLICILFLSIPWPSAGYDVEGTHQTINEKAAKSSNLDRCLKNFTSFCEGIEQAVNKTSSQRLEERGEKYANKTTEDVRLTSNIKSGVPPLEITFTVDYDYNNYINSLIVQAEMDFEGDGVTDLNPTSTTFTHTYETPGDYYPTITLTDERGNTYTVRTAVVIYDRNEMHALLKSKWNGMNQALIDGNIERALKYFHEKSRAKYSEILTLLQGEIENGISRFGDIELIYLKETMAKCRIRRYQNIDGQDRWVTYYIYFVKDPWGMWKIRSF